MKLSMNIISLALLAMTGVTADGPVRVYHPSLFVCYMYVPQLFVSWDGESDCVTKSHGHVELLCQRLNSDAPVHGHSEFGCERCVDRADYLFRANYVVKRKGADDYTIPLPVLRCYWLT